MFMDSSIRIDSISIDLTNSCASEKCSHFSIRGFVSESRKRDWKRCWPFASDGDSNKCEEQTCELPPLYAPTYRYWRCQNCLQELGGECTANNSGPVIKSSSTGFKPISFCSHAKIVDDAAMLLPSFQQALKLAMLEGKKTDTNDSSNLYDTNECHQSSCIDRKEKKTEGHSMQSEGNLNQEFGLTCNAKEAISSLMQETHHTGDIAVASCPKCNGSIHPCEPGSVHHEVAGSTGILNCMVENAAKICEVVKETSVFDKEELIVYGTSGGVVNTEQVPVANDNSSGHPSLESNECDYASSDSAEMLVESRDLHDNSSSLHRRKTRKTRLLTELLCDKVDGHSDIIRTEDSPSNAIPDASAEPDMLPVLQDQMAIQGNVKKSHNKKRKLPQDEEWRPPETSPLNKVCKEATILKRDAESTDVSLHSESAEDAFAGMGFDTGMRNQLTKRKIDKSCTSKKKNKMALTFDESLSSPPSRENVPNEIGHKTGDTLEDKSANSVLLESVQNSFTGKVMDLFPLPAQRMEREPSLIEQKIKMPQVDDQRASVISWGHDMLREDPLARKDILHSAPIPSCSVQCASSAERLNLSLNSYSAAQDCDRLKVPRPEDRRTSILTWQDGTSKGQVTMRTAETKYVGNFRFSSKSASDEPIGKGVHGDLSGKRPTYRMPFLNERQNHMSQVEVGGCSLMQQKDLCNTSGNEKAITMHGKLATTRENSDQRADKVSEQGSLDDIPMEIVELMAKNQYERCLPDAEYDKCQLELNNKTMNGQTMDFTKVYGHQDLSLFQQKTIQKQKPWARNGIVKRDENTGPSKQKLVDYFSQADQNRLSMRQPEQPHQALGFRAFLHQAKPSTEVQRSASNASGKNDAQNCKWFGDVEGKVYPQASLQASGPCNTFQGTTQQSKEANRIWSSIMPNQMPLAYTIPQKHATSCINRNVLSHSPANRQKENMNGDHDVNFLNLNGANSGKQTRSFGSETLSKPRAQYPFSCRHNSIELNQKPMGSLDLYSNETIPAMHLLSLMDAGLQSSGTMTLDVTSNLLKRPPVTHDHDPRSFSAGQKATNIMKHPPFDYRGKSQLVDHSHEHGPAIRTTIAASPSLHNKNFKRITKVGSQVSQQKEKRKGLEACVQNKGLKSQKSTSRGGKVGSNCGSIPVHSMRTVFPRVPDLTPFPLQFHELGNSMKHKLDIPSTSGTVQPHKRRLETEICSINRNPADFSIPKAGNIYTLAGEDLKFGNVVPSANGSGLIKLNGHKQQRKLPSVKEHGQRQIS